MVLGLIWCGEPCE